MSHTILITGASGYLGGTLLARWTQTSLPAYKRLFALVRSDEQATLVKKHFGGVAEPLQFDTKDGAAVREAVVTNHISIVYFLIDAMTADAQVHFIRALAEVKRSTGLDVHFLHTSGAKIFSSHAGAPTDRPLLDTEADLYEIQKAQKAPIPLMQSAVNTNNTVIEQAESLGVHSYIFVPCIVYGRGEGFGNRISIQTVAIVRAARALRRVYNVDSGRPSWPVCHVLDNTSLYLALLRGILSSSSSNDSSNGTGAKPPGCGKHGYYLASSGHVVWEDLYAAMGTRLAQRGLVDGDPTTAGTVEHATDDVLGKMGAALGCPKELVALHLGGRCTFTARHGAEDLAWQPAYPASHILQTAGEEVDLILENLGG
ncbi:uncharacterized protein Z519_06626 [Cladophialophora bantiana CBS 173.52]|uniref:NAD-dependent epimerase/dehydratase domain-containing protein n=1 Tax=Cladophialophora bantiana (strain ATCC 10958 / CBS 173.52 / CDC B-1940 / NIH 8579) TaxID=1442370 RepID=A0A0D2G215_CLAB1|nr:uncharacterized protein Z519_06626 [Cladophialophora bantiana CBS 173.52]KIW92777.1 hypothetical protein Z519_06626 [Cladophialophora bantiana CBS 173.52]